MGGPLSTFSSSDILRDIFPNYNKHFSTKVHFCLGPLPLGCGGQMEAEDTKDDKRRRSTYDREIVRLEVRAICGGEKRKQDQKG